MHTYVLSYVLHTDIKQGGHGVYSNAKKKVFELEASSDSVAKRRAVEAWDRLQLEYKHISDAQVVFVGLARKVNWTPEEVSEPA